VTDVHRRTLLLGTAAVGTVLGAGVTAGCGGGSNGATVSPGVATSPGAGSTPASTGADGSAGATGPTGDGGGAPLAETSAVPVGGGVIDAGAKVVVTQPVAGTIKAFSAVCTHAGCLVSSVSDGAIVCPCHGSRFSVADGSVLQGPAAAPLAPQPVTVTQGEVRLG